MNDQEKEVFSEVFQYLSIIREKLISLHGATDNILVQEIVLSDIEVFAKMQTKFNRLSR